jgi:hypothetical protein
MDSIANLVTRYVAERIVEKERALAADWAESRHGEEPEEVRSHSRGSVFWAVTGFLLGAVAGAVLLLAYAWVQVG